MDSGIYVMVWWTALDDYHEWETLWNLKKVYA